MEPIHATTFSREPQADEVQVAIETYSHEPGSRFPAVVEGELHPISGYAPKFRPDVAASIVQWINATAGDDDVRAHWDGATIVLTHPVYDAEQDRYEPERCSPDEAGFYVIGDGWHWRVAPQHASAAPKALATNANHSGYVPFFAVPEHFTVEHRGILGPVCADRCDCAPSTPEGEYLLSMPPRVEQIEVLLASQGRTVEMCGPCNTLIFAVTDQERRAFWHRHPDCEWDN